MRSIRGGPAAECIELVVVDDPLACAGRADDRNSAIPPALTPFDQIAEGMTFPFAEMRDDLRKDIGRLQHRLASGCNLRLFHRVLLSGNLGHFVVLGEKFSLPGT